MTDLQEMLKIGDTITFIEPSLNAGRKADVIATDTLLDMPIVHAAFLTVHIHDTNTHELAENRLVFLGHDNFTIDRKDI
jgi:hypothetical protein